MGCDKDDSFTDFDFDEKHEEVHTAMVLVDRGECSFVTKTRHIAKEGGHLAIIIDD